MTITDPRNKISMQIQKTLLDWGCKILLNDIHQKCKVYQIIKALPAGQDEQEDVPTGAYSPAAQQTPAPAYDPFPVEQQIYINIKEFWALFSYTRWADHAT